MNDDDPLGLKQLALHYDYLIYRINDHIAGLSQDTYEAVSTKERAVTQEYLGDQLQLAQQLEDVDVLLQKCSELELEFMKVDQLKVFVGDFKERVLQLEMEFLR